MLTRCSAEAVESLLAECRMKLTSVLAILLSSACDGRWVVFGSPPDMPWAWGPVTGSGCRCGCDDLDRCIADSLAPLDHFAGLVRAAQLREEYRRHEEVA